MIYVYVFRGSNLFEVISADGKIELSLLPKKFHKLIWVKRNEFVIVLRELGDSEEVAECLEANSGKVRSVIQHVLTKEQIKHLVKSNLWPPNFNIDHKEASHIRSYTGADLLPGNHEEEEEEDYEEEEESGNEGSHEMMEKNTQERA